MTTIATLRYGYRNIHTTKSTKIIIINTHEEDTKCGSIYSTITKKVRVTIIAIMIVTMNKFL